MTALAITVSLLLQGLLLWRLPRLAPPRLVLAAALCLVLLAAWAVDGPILATLIPWPGLPWWGNLTPVAAAAATALARGEPRRLRLGLLAMVAAADLWLAWPLLTAAPVEGPAREAGGFAMQTTERTCGPAAAANLLRLNGIAADEAGMSRLCGTTRSGTTDWGIVDGLRRAGVGVRFRRIAYAELDPAMLPAVVSVRLTPAVQARDPRYAERWGWIPGVRHSIVLDAVAGGKAQVIDPAVGRETWDERALRDLWDGSVISLR